jgi:arylsulfatase A-like enzyme
MDTHPVETLAVYFQGIDVASHDLTRYVYGENVNKRRRPRVRGPEVRRAMARVDAMYARIDRIVGELLEKTSEGTDVIVVSDHGWEYDGTSHLNLNPGVFIAAGPSFRNGGRLDDLSVLDVLPIMLAILGLPLSQDLDGRIPEEVFPADLDRTPERIEAYPMKAVALPDGVTSEAPDDRMMLERLRGLGYIE